MNKLLGILAVTPLFIASCVSYTSHPKKKDALRAHLDTTVRPGDDFFEYANGGWMKKNPIPPEETTYGIGRACAEGTLHQAAEN